MMPPAAALPYGKLAQLVGRDRTLEPGPLLFGQTGCPQVNDPYHDASRRRAVFCGFTAGFNS